MESLADVTRCLGEKRKLQHTVLRCADGSAQARDLPRYDWVITVDQSGPTTAFAKVHGQIPPRYFTDYLPVRGRTQPGGARRPAACWSPARGRGVDLRRSLQAGRRGQATGCR